MNPYCDLALTSRRVTISKQTCFHLLLSHLLLTWSEKTRLELELYEVCSKKNPERNSINHSFVHDRLEYSWDMENTYQIDDDSDKLALAI